MVSNFCLFDGTFSIFQLNESYSWGYVPEVADDGICDVCNHLQWVSDFTCSTTHSSNSFQSVDRRLRVRISWSIRFSSTRNVRVSSGWVEIPVITALTKAFSLLSGAARPSSKVAIFSLFSAAIALSWKVFFRFFFISVGIEDRSWALFLEYGLSVLRLFLKGSIAGEPRVFNFRDGSGARGAWWLWVCQHFCCLSGVCWGSISVLFPAAMREHYCCLKTIRGKDTKRRTTVCTKSQRSQGIGVLFFLVALSQWISTLLKFEN